jgi:hypothetical protein
MKELGITMDFKAKTISIDDITFPVIASPSAKMPAHSACKS